MKNTLGKILCGIIDLIMWANIVAWFSTIFIAAFTFIFTARTNWTLISAHLLAEVAAVTDKDKWSPHGIMVLWFIFGLLAMLCLHCISAKISDVLCDTRKMDTIKSQADYALSEITSE